MCNPPGLKFEAVRSISRTRNKGGKNGLGDSSRIDRYLHFHDRRECARDTEKGPRPRSLKGDGTGEKFPQSGSPR